MQPNPCEKVYKAVPPNSAWSLLSLGVQKARATTSAMADRNSNQKHRHTNTYTRTDKLCASDQIS